MEEEQETREIETKEEGGLNLERYEGDDLYRIVEEE
jgi:hypothetical protein